MPAHYSENLDFQLQVCDLVKIRYSGSVPILSFTCTAWATPSSCLTLSPSAAALWRSPSSFRAISDEKAIQRLYSKLLSLYPRAFRERLAVSLQQTFDDLYSERKRQTEKGVFAFVLWMFLDTAIGICREHLLMISPGDIMQSILKTLGSSALISFLLIIPFMIMEIVNRQNFHKDYPLFLFFVIWLNLFAFSLILLPIVQARRKPNDDLINPVPAQEKNLLTNPRSAAMISIFLILSIVLFGFLVSSGWRPLNRLVNGPNPEQFYVSGQVISLTLLLIPVAAGRIAGKPIIRTLQAGGSLFAHPINMLIVVFLLCTFALGYVNLLIDQWPCFMGVLNCD